MKKIRIGWQLWLGMILLLLSAMLYLIHYAIFRNAHDIYFYLLLDIAFIPIEVFLVTLVIHQLLNKREKKLLMEKLNMVIGAFFSEVGNGLLKTFSAANLSSDDIKSSLKINGQWTDKDFQETIRKSKHFNFQMNYSQFDWESLKAYLVSKRGFLINLLGNPNLLEHESFTELLWAAFHLDEELECRKSFRNLPASDYEHLAGDIKRVNGLITGEWLNYMKHMKNNYPYLYSLAVRTNPFDSNASPEV